MRSTPNSIQQLRNNISAPLGHLLVSNRADDTYIAAFPRSGSTWLRTIITNILDPRAKGDPDVFNKRIPAVSIRNSVQINKLKSPRIIMTHSCWRKQFSKAIYVVRDGRDSFISYYHYQTARRGISMGMDEFFSDYVKGVYGVTWERHIDSWINSGKSAMGKNLLIIKFEDMKGDTNMVTRDVCDFLGIAADNELLDSAIEFANLENARQLELDRQGVLKDKNASFYRQGGEQQWKAEENQSVMQRFVERSKNALIAAGYAN